MFLTTSIAPFILCILIGVNPIQERSPSNHGCALIDGTLAPQFIKYEGKSESEIYLRLRNNTSCAMIVETDDNYPTQVKKLPQGGVTIESVLDSRDGLRLRLHYLIQNRGQGETLKRAYGWGILYSPTKFRPASQSRSQFP